MTKVRLHLRPVNGLLSAKTAEGEPSGSVSRPPARSAGAVATVAPAPEAARGSRRQESGPATRVAVRRRAPLPLPAVTSPHGGPTSARQALNDRFADRVAFDPEFTRRTVSYQGNRRVPGLRWMKYKEGFSRDLVDYLLDEYEPERVLDPFAGIGTTALIAAGRGMRATGIELMPVGVLAGVGIAEAAADGLSRAAVVRAAAAIRRRMASTRSAAPAHAFPHVRITRGAFPAATESAVGKAREFIADMKDGAARTLLNLACMSVLEAASYTRKDGQYLRWDNRSGRKLRARMNKGFVPSFPDALDGRLSEMADDLGDVRRNYGRRRPELVRGSSLELLRTRPDGAFDMVVTSPPYANRYDYTRTYALELAWLGIDQDGFSGLRQQMLSATVENRTKIGALRKLYGDAPDTLTDAVAKYERQAALHEVLGILREHAPELGNRHVIRLLEGYFLEMAVIVTELGRLVRPGGHVVMVNDNVQYHGEEVPVDFILSDFAEQSGFTCAAVWTLARGKGNASQQMGRFGRREIRKCVYHWIREG